MTMEEESEDSLDLLLDTLCNAFGAIILITLMITILSQEANNILPVKNFKNQFPVGIMNDPNKSYSSLI